MLGWWFLKYCLMFIPKIGEMIQFDDHIFQMGWFNHQLVIYIYIDILVFRP